MTPKELKKLADQSHLNIKESIRDRLETAASNGNYKIIFHPNSYEGPFLLPASMRKEFLNELTSDGFQVKCETRWWKSKTITISWE